MVPPSSTSAKTKSVVKVPGSKSLSNRVLLMAGLATGTTRLTGLLHSDDTQVMMRALELLGASFVWEQDARILKVQGEGGKFRFPRRSHLIMRYGITISHKCCDASTVSKR